MGGGEVGADWEAGYAVVGCGIEEGDGDRREEKREGKGRMVSGADECFWGSLRAGDVLRRQGMGEGKGMGSAMDTGRERSSC